MRISYASCQLLLTPDTVVYADSVSTYPSAPSMVPTYKRKDKSILAATNFSRNLLYSFAIYFFTSSDTACGQPS